ncbi:GAF domain-containing protein [Sphingomonas sp. RS2018]
MSGWAIDDAERLRTLEELGIASDAPADPVLDDIAAEAAALCGTPVALVTLLDRETQWFRAKVGTDLPGTPVAVAICAHTLAAGAALTIPDLAEDPRTADNPLVTLDPRVRFYAGVPLVTDGQAVGTLCVLDLAPRDGLTKEQQAGLEALADRAQQQLTG